MLSVFILTVNTGVCIHLSQNSPYRQESLIITTEGTNWALSKCSTKQWQTGDLDLLYLLGWFTFYLMVICEVFYASLQCQQNSTTYKKSNLTEKNARQQLMPLDCIAHFIALFTQVGLAHKIYMVLCLFIYLFICSFVFMLQDLSHALTKQVLLSPQPPYIII